MEIRLLARYLTGIILLLATWVSAAGRSSWISNLISTSPDFARGEALPLVMQSLENTGHIESIPQINCLQDLRHALNVMQSTWFELWVGAWPSSIDWTGAVINTHLVASLKSLSDALELEPESNPKCLVDVENELNRYFGQIVAYYFGEDTFAIRNEAFDDMLWVVLGWLEAIKFVGSHSRRHYRSTEQDSETWHGLQFLQAFAHRARVFYDLASKGWDTELCGGGMVWNPSLSPYKNAITNELFISASVGMYLYFPGDCNDSPFISSKNNCSKSGGASEHDRSYLHAAVAGYAWLKDSNMTNNQGLYVDGFHIRNWGRNGGKGTGKCDERNEAVYTYNQGVLLSGLRALWESTGNTTYLEDGHELVRNTIKATGWQIDDNSPPPNDKWSGMGRSGIIEDFCDSSRRCNQDAQTFKGIYFHHLSLFCEALPILPVVPGKTFAASKGLSSLHHNSCSKYLSWVEHNAKAAIRTKDDNGRFNGWWGAFEDYNKAVVLPPGAIDYRNNVSELDRPDWILSQSRSGLKTMAPASRIHDLMEGRPSVPLLKHHMSIVSDVEKHDNSPTIETHSGGIAVLRALWELQRIV